MFKTKALEEVFNIHRPKIVHIFTPDMEMPHLKDLSLPAYVSLFPYVGQVHLGSYTLKGHI